MIVDRDIKPENMRISAGKANWGSDLQVIEFARAVLGGIDLDPASSSYWNHYTVKAARFYDKRINGLTQRWRGRTFLNAPGKEKGAPRTDPGPREFWERLVESYKANDVPSAIYVGFTLEQLQMLQQCPMHPGQFVTLIPADRRVFLQQPHQQWCRTLDDRTRAELERKGVASARLNAELEKLCSCGRSGTGPPEDGDSPTHGNFVTLLYDRGDRARGAQQVRTFMELASRLDGVHGAVVRPT